MNTTGQLESSRAAATPQRIEGSMRRALLSCLLPILSVLGSPASAEVFNVEVDWLVAGGHSHKPDPCEMAYVQWVFERQGHTLNIEMSNAITETAALQIIEIDGQGFDGGEWAALELVHRDHPANTGWHWAVFAHQYQYLGGGTGSSGLAEGPGDESMVTMGAFIDQIGTPWDRAATFVHELGHNLGLSHSGDQPTVGPFKPNLASVMAYSYQLIGVNNGMVCRDLAPPSVELYHLDYSEGTLDDLDEAALDESVGLGLGLGVDWDCSGGIGGVVDQELSNDADWCDGSSTSDEVLTDYDEWSNIVNVARQAETGEPPPVVSCITTDENEERLRALGGCSQVDPCLLGMGCNRSIALNEPQWGFFSFQCPSVIRPGASSRFHFFTILANTAVTIDLESIEADTWLYLRVGHDPSGPVIFSDDDGGDGTNSRFVGNLSAGNYTVEATTFSPSVSGNYKLTVGGIFFPMLTVERAGGGSGTVTSSPAGIDCGNDCSAQFANTTPITLTATPDANSTFTGWSGGGCSGTGTCQLTLSANTTVTATFGPICVLPIDLNDSIEALWVSDCASQHRPPGSFAKYYTFSLATATTVTIDLRSFSDAYLYLLQGSSSTGTVIASDDDSGIGRDARIVTTLNPGTYTIEATTHDPGVIGPFFLDLVGSAPVPDVIFADGFESGDVSGWILPPQVPGLLHQWSFSTDASDSVGSAHGTLQGGAAIVAKAVSLDGVDDYVELPIANTLSSLTSCTIEAWLTVDTLVNWARIFDFGTGPEVNFFATAVGNTGVMRAAITDSGFPGEEQVDSHSALPVGTNVYFAITIDATSNAVALYVNGGVVGTATWTLDPASLGPLTNLWLGRSQYPDPHLDGRFDDVRIYGRALTGQEIFDSYEAGPDDVVHQ